MASTKRRVSAVFQSGVEGNDCIFVYDRRQGNSPVVSIPEESTGTFKIFTTAVKEKCKIPAVDKIVFTTTSREEINQSNWEHIELGDTLYILSSVDQELPAQAKEIVNFLPHYDTIVKGGMYEYYASEGQNPLPYAFAELIDNALAATAENFGPRNIEILLHLDDANPAKNTVFIIDNGKGMTSRQLNNWAIYRLSKFIRKDRKGKLPEDGLGNSSSPLELPPAPRSLNSDISYFGVGGKQAIFFIGTSTRMISKPRGFQDVHELVISKEEFEQREKNREAIYSGYIRNRKPCDCSHIPSDEEALRNIITEEKDRESFTAVVISGISPVHIPYLKQHFKEWTRQLAHIYHYYIHGPNGNLDKDMPAESSPIKKVDVMPDDWFAKINIEVKLYAKNHPKLMVNLRDISDDMQTQYIQSSASSFEFKATVEGMGIVEGVLRYHPFLYDRETYPSDANDPRAEPDPEDDHDYTVSDVRPARGRRPIFECYWNGRLIPYTSIEDFDWCSAPKKSKTVPSECYNRISGVLFSNDKFQVSTNKLTFIDLEMKLKDKNTVYHRIAGKSEKRTDIGKELVNWLKECHGQCDKQVKFSQYQGNITRPDLPKNRQGPWAVFGQIEWDGKVFKKGTLVRVAKSNPIFYGSIRRFLLFGEYEGDVFATGGEMEVAQEPKSLYDDTKLVPLSKLDRMASPALVKRYLEEEETKLPDKLLVTWPDGDEVAEGEKRPAGKTVGAIKVEISNRRGELVSKLPGSTMRKLLMELKILWHSNNRDEVIVQHISQHGKTWPYWFRKMENIKNLGSYTLVLQAVVNESGAQMFAGRQLPSHKLKFTVTEAEPEKFTVGMLEGPFRIGSSFQIPLEFQDEFGHQSKPSNSLKPVIDANGLSLTYDDTQLKGNLLIIKGIKAVGEVPSSAGKSFNLSVKVPGLEQEVQSLKIRMLPGIPHKLSVSPEDDQVFENGTAVQYEVKVFDEANNVTCQHKLGVQCKFSGALGLPSYSLDCSNTGQGTITGPPINIAKMTGEQKLTAKLELTGVKTPVSVERHLVCKPSSRAATLTVWYTKDGEKEQLTSGQDIFGKAGDVLKGITFSLADEAHRPIEVDSTLAPKIKVNWTPKISQDTVMKGCLPDVKVPSSVTDSKYCHITLADGSGLDFSFTLKALIGEPAQMKCKCAGSSKVRMGKTLSSDIIISIKDKHGNEIKKFEKGVLKDLEITGEGLVESEMFRALGQTSGFHVHGIRFESGSLGTRELRIKWRDLTDYVRIEIEAGPPTKLTLPGWDTEEQIVVVYNEKKLKQPLIAQLCDELDNPSAEENVRVQLGKDTGIKLNPAPQPMKTDKHGRVNFGTPFVSGKSGVYELQPKAFLGRSILSAPKIKISIQPDATKPVQVNVESDRKPTSSAGGDLPDFKVTVIAEDDGVMASAKPSSLTMKLWKSDDAQSRPPSRSVSFSPDEHTEGVFYFKDRRLPEVSGLHNILFQYQDGKYSILSSVISINIQPGPPVRLVAGEPPGTPTVSNGRNSSTRSLIRNLQLQLQDEFGNLSGLTLSGAKLLVSIAHSSKSSGELPVFVGNSATVTVPFQKGKATLSNLSIQENSAGKDGQSYLIRCHVECSSLTKKSAIPPFDIPFLFYNDVKKQAQMAALTKERDNINSVIRTYKSLFDTTQQLIDELRLSLDEAQVEENKLKTELRKMGIPASQLTSTASVDNIVSNKQSKKEEIKNHERRMCGLAPAPNDIDVLGKIAHLAQISDSDIARVLSWHMSADMDCVVTMTTKKAKELYQRSQGKQQVLPLDSIYKRNLPDWNKPLPHIKVRPGWRPPGNPVYARNLLTFPQQGDSCRIVFGMLLGDTLILDSLDDANMYRQELVRHTHCPTILTRGGDRIRSNGKFGGLMNKALPIDKLRGAVFSEPMPAEYSNLASQIAILQNLRAAIVKRKNAQKELDEQLWNQKTAEMKKKKEEFMEAEEQLQDIQKRIDLTLSASRQAGGQATRTIAAVDSPSASPALKRSRASSLASTPKVNGTPTPSPSRQSTRRRTLTPIAAAAAEEAAKEAKRRRKT